MALHWKYKKPSVSKEQQNSWCQTWNQPSCWQRNCSTQTSYCTFRSSKHSSQSIPQYDNSSRQFTAVNITAGKCVQHSLENPQPQSTQISTITKAPFVQRSNRKASNVLMSTAIVLSMWFSIPWQATDSSVISLNQSQFLSTHSNQWVSFILFRR